MKQIIQSYKTGDLWLADVPIPACTVAAKESLRTRAGSGLAYWLIEMK